MKALEIKKDICWVGGIDWDLRNFHGYLTQRGSTYNSYLIKDEKTVLVDTVKECLYAEMLGRIGSVSDPADIDLVICNHVEMDHSGSLPRLMELCPNATVVTSPNGEKGLKKHYNAPWNIKVVNTGDVIDIGKRKLRFALTPMVHWPDSMVTYVEGEELLLSNDAFGQHIASPERFADEFGVETAVSEAAKYYANIVMPYGSRVKKALEDLSGLDIKMIAPSHGLVWRQDLEKITGLYQKWSANETDRKAVIVYDTMWHSTEKMAYALNEVFEAAGVGSKMMNLQVTHISDAMAEILEAGYICVGSPTLNNNLLPTISAFLTYMKGLAPKNRSAMAFGSYGWGGQSVDIVDRTLKDCGFDVWEKMKIQWVPDSGDLDVLKEKAGKCLNNDPGIKKEVS